ncbi:MAG: hypothetical protein PHH16_00655 [Candidatus Gracilibacteria bacterium]|nr:hypothetical protein [Candidatus Gracilibacteria bacterium]
MSDTIPEGWGEINSPDTQEKQAPATAGYVFSSEPKPISPNDTKDIDQDKTLSFGEYSLSIDEVYRDIKRLTLSRNPLDLIFKANEIREKFAFFINSLANFISQSFSSFDNDSFINELYHDSKYHHVWMELAYPFLRDIHYCSDRFDRVAYTKKDDNGVSQEYIIDKAELLKRFDKNMMDDNDFIAVKALIQIIIEIYRENKNLKKRWEKENLLCDMVTGFEKRSIHSLCQERIVRARSKVSELIPRFSYEKESFRTEMENIFESFNLSLRDQEELRIFAFKEIADLYYPDIRYIFFDTSLPFIKEDRTNENEQFLTKRNWLKLKGMQELSINTIGIEKDEEASKVKNQEYFKHILNFKELILELEGSIVSPILLPVILKLVASAMTLDKKEFYKFSYILLFLFANSYENEYIPLSRFLNELEVYINFNNANRSMEKLKIGFSLVMLFVLFVGLGYFLLPPLVYIPGVILTGIYLKMYFLDDYTFSAGIRYNLGMRLWSTLLLAIFGYIWITNIGSYTAYYGNLQKRFTGFGSQIVAEILPPEKIAEGVKNGTASILQWNKKAK